MKPSISFAKQWAEANKSSAGIEGIVAALVLTVLDSPPLCADRLAAIQRSFDPIDDDGTLRMEVGRSDVESLLVEVLRLRAETIKDVSPGEKECPDPTALAVDEKPPQSEPESTEPTAFATSDVVTATTARPESRSRRHR